MIFLAQAVHSSQLVFKMPVIKYNKDHIRLSSVTKRRVVWHINTKLHGVTS